MSDQPTKSTTPVAEEAAENIASKRVKTSETASTEKKPEVTTAGKKPIRPHVVAEAVDDEDDENEEEEFNDEEENTVLTTGKKKATVIEEEEEDYSGSELEEEAYSYSDED